MILADQLDMNGAVNSNFGNSYGFYDFSENILDLNIFYNDLQGWIQYEYSNPPDIGFANNDIRKFSDMKLELHKHRERKLTDLAREKINGQNPNTENVHDQENEYLTSLCEVIETHRKRTLLGKMGKSFADTPNPKEKTIKKEVKPKAETPIVKEETKIKQEIVEQKEIPEEYIEVEVLEDLPTFTGMDAKNYTLKNSKKEIIPIYNAKMLRDAGKVKIINEVKA